MARRAFYSFHYQPDNWRAAQVRSMGVIDGNSPASDNDWESVCGRGDGAIQKWIDDQLYGKSCAVVLIGAETSGRKWINYEIKKAWKDGKGIVGVHIHGLKNSGQYQSKKGENPFAGFTVGNTTLSSIVRTYDPPHWESKQVYAYIADNLANWFDEAVAIREKY